MWLSGFAQRECDYTNYIVFPDMNLEGSADYEEFQATGCLCTRAIELVTRTRRGVWEWTEEIILSHGPVQGIKPVIISLGLIDPEDLGNIWCFQGSNSMRELDLVILVGHFRPTTFFEEDEERMFHENAIYGHRDGDEEL
ncbi:hypothetical protein DUI87_04747 [Hirundo rustica rustica]|uniref:Uncharacterized protein n=1 Tax=Hirundo rustica rustica TaxID=333673 RepID=A0A3M0L1G7_HIRRU|nr:hypothetical protein DUI87_04747 [Hirundo rustica rustica]